ncbi:histidine kinase [Streptomyces sp. MP131-18]|uniref:sensor histidine kinase n=1 Tax=Streptomyces sp. MP131-18 TaxID=1857892 RepID=UPI000D1B6E5C|nr:histidine kinase [Streptomyces sp. MP131-18]
MAAPLAGSVLLVLPAPFAAAGLPPSAVGLATVGTAVGGLVLHGLARPTALIRRAHLATTELLRSRLAGERRRFARDVHDLLGYSVSAITLKAEPAPRLTDARPERARAEIVSLLDVSRRALSDVRSVAHGYRTLSLAHEASMAHMILAAGIEAGVEAGIDVERCGRPPPEVDALLATALREGVTNVLGHSDARHCRTTADRQQGTVRLELTNDGVAPANGATASAGHGTGNLTARFTAARGRVHAGATGGFFRLTTEVPAPARWPAAARAGQEGTSAAGPRSMSGTTANE